MLVRASKVLYAAARTKVVRRGISSRVLAPMYLAHMVTYGTHTYARVRVCMHTRGFTAEGGRRGQSELWWEGRGDRRRGKFEGVM